MLIKQKTPGKKLLKVAGILMIIVGVSLLRPLGGGLVGYIRGEMEKSTAFMMCTMGLVGVLQFVAGMVGVRNSGQLERATTCFIWGIIAMVSAVIGIILGLAMEPNWSAFMGNNIYALLFAPPILYLIGAVWNRNEVIRAAK